MSDILQYKPDFNRAKEVWEAFWAGEIAGRPPVLVSVTKPGTETINVTANRYINAVHGKHEEQLGIIDRWLESTLFLGELIPKFAPDHGPDQVAACLGTELIFNQSSRNHTNWAKPAIDDWDVFMPLKLRENNATWASLLRFSRTLANHSEGRYLVSCIDFHTHFDALAALRHNDRLCMDFYDFPAVVKSAAEQAAALYPKIYSDLYEAGNMGGDRGCIGAHPFWSPGRFATIQCDFIALVGPVIFRKYIMPAIESEVAFLDHCSFHLDGPAALTHLDDILAIEGIDIIQWVPGAGQRPDNEWPELMKRCQEAGKAVWVRDVDFQKLKALHSELRPNRVIYSLSARDETEAQHMMQWLVNNT